MSIQDDMVRGEQSLEFGLSVFSSIIHPFTRCSFGRNYFGVQSVLGLLALWFYCGMTTLDGSPCVLFTLCWFAARLVHRYRFHRYGFGAEQLSTYNGWPTVCKGDFSENHAKLAAEPAAMGSLAVLIMVFVNDSLGVFLLFCTGCSWLEHVKWMGKLDAFMEQLRDAELEQQIVMDEYEKRYRL